MTYQHFEPPVATVTLLAKDFPQALAAQILIDGWNHNYTGVMHMISALSIYRVTVYDRPLSATVEMAMHFTETHPPVMRRVNETSQMSTIRRSNELATQLLDYIKFFEGLPE